MSLISIALIIAIIGFFLWLINKYIPLPASIKTLLNMAVVIAIVVWLLFTFGLMNSIDNFTFDSFD